MIIAKVGLAPLKIIGKTTFSFTSPQEHFMVFKSMIFSSGHRLFDGTDHLKKQENVFSKGKMFGGGNKLKWMEIKGWSGGCYHMSPRL